MPTVTVRKIKYQSDNLDNYCILFVSEAGGKTFTVKGKFPLCMMYEGMRLEVTGSWKNDRNFGEFFSVDRFHIPSEMDRNTVMSLMDKFSNASPYTVRLILDHYKNDADLLYALEHEEELQKVSFLTVHGASELVAEWCSIRDRLQLNNLLQRSGVTNFQLRSLFGRFGSNLIQVMKERIWEFVLATGITPKDVRSIAHRLDLKFDLDVEIKTHILFLLKETHFSGHTCMRAATLFSSLQQSMGRPVAMEDFGKSLVCLRDTHQIFVDSDVTEGKVVYFYEYYKYEKESAGMLLQRAKQPSIMSRFRLAFGIDSKTSDEEAARTLVREYEQNQTLILSEEQREGLVNALCHNVSVLTGLPGTGKTTSLRVFVKIIQDAGLSSSLLLLAPTGIAARRMQEATSYFAFTIHRAFGAKGKKVEKRDSTYVGVVGDSLQENSTDWNWGFDPQAPHSADIIIIDESSMVDISLLYRILYCTRSTATLLFVGDDAQLPPVGSGYALRDLIQSRVFPTVQLVKIFRQEEASGIIPASHSVYQGEVPEFNSDFLLVPALNESDAHQRCLDLADDLHNQREEFQILSPRHKGSAGVTAFNESARELFNPAQRGTREKSIGKSTIREGDRVMVIRNDYDRGVSNGDVGKVVTIDGRQKSVSVLLYRPGSNLKIDIAFKEISSYLRLAYAFTVHKSQGLAFDHIILPLLDSFSFQLQRNLLYTAMTRGVKRVYLVGTETALKKAILNNKEQERVTFLKERLSDAA
jgi:exodeoxyribonuclease V alpha subunit